MGGPEVVDHYFSVKGHRSYADKIYANLAEFYFEKLRFEETWQRDNDQPVIIEKRYPIGDDVELKRIRIRKVACACSEAPSEAE